MDLTERSSWSFGARGLYLSSRVRKGRYRDTFPRNRGRGRISSDIEPDVVGKEMKICLESDRREGNSDDIRVFEVA